MPWFKCNRKEVKSPPQRRGITTKTVQGGEWRLEFVVAEDYGNGYYRVRYTHGGNSVVYSLVPDILNNSEIIWI